MGKLIFPPKNVNSCLTIFTSVAMFAFWGVVIAIGLGGRFIAALGSHHREKRRGWKRVSSQEVEDGTELSTKRGRPFRHPYVWLQRFILIPATFGYRTSQDFGWYTVPPRVQSLTILAFVLMNIAFCVHGYHVFPGNLYWPEEHHQLWRYVSDRTGIVSFANFPLIWLFGMRNNLLLWVTGWDFGTYNNFHRWVARVATVQAVVHSIGYTMLVLEDGGWPLFAWYWTEFWWTTGEIATILMCALIPLSLFWMRRNTYELFLVLHILLSVIILATMWGHISIFKKRYDIIIWVCCALWVLDRLLRAVRTLAFNRLPWTTRALATYDPAANMIRLSVPCAKSLYQPTPGTFYYLYLLNDARFWESHPFTMAKYQGADDSRTTECHAEGIAQNDEMTSLLTQADRAGSVASGNASICTRAAASTAMTFLIRPYDSFTKRLRDAAYAAYPHPAALPMLVEGPYGHAQSFDRFDHVLFVVGGSGIVVPLVHLEKLCGSVDRRNTSVHIAWSRPRAGICHVRLRAGPRPLPEWARIREFDP